jgi:hypothetical protein
MAPVLTFWMVVVFHAWLVRLRAVASAAEPSPA